jgi:hypothetical protein
MKVHRHIHKSPVMDPILAHTNQVHILQPIPPAFNI